VSDFTLQHLQKSILNQLHRNNSGDPALELPTGHWLGTIPNRRQMRTAPRPRRLDLRPSHDANMPMPIFFMNSQTRSVSLMWYSRTTLV